MSLMSVCYLWIIAPISLMSVPCSVMTSVIIVYNVYTVIFRPGRHTSVARLSNSISSHSLIVLLLLSQQNVNTMTYCNKMGDRFVYLETSSILPSMPTYRDTP